MINFLRARSASLSLVVLILLVIVLVQATLSYVVAFGRLERFIPSSGIRTVVSGGWLALRIALCIVTVWLWAINRKRALFRAIVALNSLLTIGLTVNMIALLEVLFDFSARAIGTLLEAVVLMAISNILIFSIWYWIIDPPGVEENLNDDAPWDFLFPQRAAAIPHYEKWLPRYSDYLYVAFTTSFAFSPTDTMPLTRRAKMLMLLQSAISIVTITGLAGSAINVLAGLG